MSFHRCERWWIRGLPCPLGPRAGEEEEDDDDEAREPVAVPRAVPARRAGERDEEGSADALAPRVPSQIPFLFPDEEGRQIPFPMPIPVPERNRPPGPVAVPSAPRLPVPSLPPLAALEPVIATLRRGASVAPFNAEPHFMLPKPSSGRRATGVPTGEGDGGGGRVQPVTPSALSPAQEQLGALQLVGGRVPSGVGAMGETVAASTIAAYAASVQTTQVGQEQADPAFTYKYLAMAAIALATAGAAASFTRGFGKPGGGSPSRSRGSPAGGGFQINMARRLRELRFGGAGARRETQPFFEGEPLS